MLRKIDSLLIKLRIISDKETESEVDKDYTRLIIGDLLCVLTMLAILLVQRYLLKDLLTSNSADVIQNTYYKMVGSTGLLVGIGNFYWAYYIAKKGNIDSSHIRQYRLVYAILIMITLVAVFHGHNIPNPQYIQLGIILGFLPTMHVTVHDILNRGTKHNK